MTNLFCVILSLIKLLVIVDIFHFTTTSSKNVYFKTSMTVDTINKNFATIIKKFLQYFFYFISFVSHMTTAQKIISEGVLFSKSQSQ